MYEQIARRIPILLFISFDGFRNDYLNPNYAPNLFELSKQATLGHMESMYVTKTFPNHFSMATGLYEDEHEIINNQMFDPRINDTFKTSVISKEWWNPSGKTMPIWTANEIYGEKSDTQPRYSASMMYPGSVAPYGDSNITYLEKFNTKRNWTENVDKVIDWLTDEDKPANFVAIYFDDPDETAHKHGPWGQETLDALRRVDSAAGYLVERLREVNLIEETNIIFVSDHGMAEVKTVIYLADFMDTSAFELYGATPVWSVFVKPDQRYLKSKIFHELTMASKENHFKVYRREDIPSEWHYSKTPRVGEFVIMVDEHIDLFKARRAKPKTPREVWGNHGWRAQDPDMRPLFFAYGPSFKKHYTHKEVFPNIDLFPLMTYLLDLPSEELPNNGSLSRIFDMIDIGHFNNGAVRKYIILLKVNLLGLRILLASERG